MCIRSVIFRETYRNGKHSVNSQVLKSDSPFSILHNNDHSDYILKWPQHFRQPVCTGSCEFVHVYFNSGYPPGWYEVSKKNLFLLLEGKIWEEDIKHGKVQKKWP